MNYKEAIEYIEEIKKYGSVLGLTSMKELMNRLDNPQDKYQVIHLAGTNGKGSTQAYVTSIFMQTGEKIGHYTSPVVFHPMEAIQINQKMIAKQTYAKYVSMVKKIGEEMVSDGYSHPTIFEINTAIAFLYFYDRGCKKVILETGLGGREDATNVINKPKICLFTSISMDHMEYLGDSLDKIAREKAGIITKNSYVVIGKNEPIVCEILKKEAIKKDAQIFFVDREQLVVGKESIREQEFSYKGNPNLKIQMMGTYQIENAALAMECVLTYNQSDFCFGEKISFEQIRKGLYQAKWFGRLSVIAQNPLFIVDGAHNERAAIRLQESVDLLFPDKKVIYIIGVLKDKEYEKIIKHTVPSASQIITVTSPVKERALSAYDLAKEIKDYNPMVTASDSIEEAVEMAYILSDKETIIIAFGSLSYLGVLTDVVQNKKKMKQDTHGLF